jgi:hypothetical protein
MLRELRTLVSDHGVFPTAAFFRSCTSVKRHSFAYPVWKFFTLYPSSRISTTFP